MNGDASMTNAFAGGGLDRLLGIAARNCPDAILLRDDAGEASAAVAARRVRRLADRMRGGGLRPGERVLILGGYEIAAVVALVAALRAGLEPVVASCSLNAAELAAAVQAAGAVAMIGPSRHGGQELGDHYLSAAAVNEAVRGLLTFGPDPVDGASDISAAALDGDADAWLDGESDASSEAGASGDERDAARESAVVATLAGPAAAPHPVVHPQAVLFADALSLAEQAGMLPSHAMLSLLPLSTLAGLVAGPFAALAGASRLVLHGPFEARRFLSRCDAEPAFHLAAPVAAAGCLVEACRGGGLVSLLPVSRHAPWQDGEFAPPPPLPADARIIDLHAFGEELLLMQPRRDGVAEPPRRTPDRSAHEGLGARLHRARVEERAGGDRQGTARNEVAGRMPPRAADRVAR